MSIKLPLTKEAAKSKFDKLFYIETNNFDPDMLLPAMFWLVRARGRDRAGMRLEQVDIRQKTVRLANHVKVKGFHNEEGERLLDKWVRSSLIQVGRSGRAQQGKEQISYVRPLSFLAYKPALPTETSRLRLVHQFVYHACSDYVERQKSTSPERRDFNKLMEDAFAEGVQLDTGGVKDGRYDEATAVDLETLLQMRYMDGFGRSARALQNAPNLPHPRVSGPPPFWRVTSPPLYRLMQNACRLRF